MLRRVQDLMRHTVPNGDLAVIFERALRLLHDDLEKKKLAATARPRKGRQRRRGSRGIPASGGVVHAVPSIRAPPRRRAVVARRQGCTISGTGASFRCHTD